ncbi:hypothetical protein lerEdw1_015844 [Lerista edwardsae]|nr:hypothetical protein lerEdw1_015844 [Lerista edwardsae]
MRACRQAGPGKAQISLQDTDRGGHSLSSCPGSERATEACNGNRYLRISRETMLKLMRQRGCLAGEDAAGEPSEDPAEDTAAQALPLNTRQPVYSPNCQWLEESDLDVESATLPGGTLVKVEAVPPGVLTKRDLACFFCCGQCGKVFWEGSHFRRVVSQCREELDLSEDGQSLYQLL